MHMSVTKHLHRVLGFIGLVRTDCDNPTELHVHSKLEWPQYLGPISIALLYYLAASDVRQWVLLYVRKLNGVSDW